MRIAKRYMILLAFVAGSALLYFILQIVLNMILAPVGADELNGFVYWAEAVFYSFCTCFVLVLGGSIAGMIVAPELIQDRFTASAVEWEVRRILESPEARAEAKAGLAEVRAKLGPGGAIERAADIFARML